MFRGCAIVLRNDADIEVFKMSKLWQFYALPPQNTPDTSINACTWHFYTRYAESLQLSSLLL